MHTDYSPPPSALHIIGNQSPLSFHLEANAFKAIKLLTIYLNLKEPNETSLQDEIDFALWLSCTCDTLGNVNFSISDWRSVSQLCDAAVSHRGEDAAALTFKVKLKVTYSQVCWPTLGIRALHLPIQVHTHSSEHAHTAVNTHTPWTHTRSSGQPLMLRRPGSIWGSGAFLKSTSSWYWELRESCIPQTIPAGPETQTHNLWITSPTLYH